MVQLNDDVFDGWRDSPPAGMTVSNQRFGVHDGEQRQEIDGEPPAGFGGIGGHEDREAPGGPSARGVVAEPHGDQRLAARVEPGRERLE